MTPSAQPPVTWILPVLNGMPYLTETLASIAAQTYVAQRIVAWDNGSTDGTREELARWIPSRIAGEVVADDPLPLGLCRAALVRRARSELVACTDADDVSRPDRIARQVDAFRRRPDLVAVGAKPTIVGARGERLTDWYYPLDDANIRWRTRWQSSLNASAVMFRRSAVLASGNYRPFDRAQDLDLWMRLIARGPIVNLRERLVSYRRHPSNLTALDTSYYEHDRRIAEANAASLFPGLSSDESMDLWLRTYPHLGAVAHLRDVGRLGEAARAAALASGLPVAAFTSTRFFRRQVRYVLLNVALGRGGR